MLKRIITLVTVFLTGLTISGCAVRVIWPGTQVKLDPAFWEDKSAPVAIALVPSPLEGHIYRFDTKYPGSITEIDDAGDTGDLVQFVRRYDFSMIKDLKEIFSEELTKRGMKIVPFDEKTLSEIRHAQQVQNTEDVNALLNRQTGAAYLVIFSVKPYGIHEDIVLPWVRRYSGIIDITGKLIDLRTSAVKWEHITAIKEVKVSGNWDQPPDYPNIAQAIHTVTLSAMHDLQKSFFK